MRTATSQYEIVGGTHLHSFGTACEVYAADEDSPLLALPRAATYTSKPLGLLSVGRFRHLLLAAVFTSPVMFFNPEEENRRSGVYSVTIRREAGARKRIGLKEARLLALRVLDEAEEGIRRDRLVEARLLASIWDQEQA